jgi:hypothetical protein
MVMLMILIALIMEAASTSEKSVNFYQTTRRNNPEDSHLLSFLCPFRTFVTYLKVASQKSEAFTLKAICSVKI